MSARKGGQVVAHVLTLVNLVSSPDIAALE